MIKQETLKRINYISWEDFCEIFRQYGLNNSCGYLTEKWDKFQKDKMNYLIELDEELFKDFILYGEDYNESFKSIISSKLKSINSDLGKIEGKLFALTSIDDIGEHYDRLNQSFTMLSKEKEFLNRLLEE